MKPSSLFSVHRPVGECPRCSCLRNHNRWCYIVEVVCFSRRDGKHFMCCVVSLARQVFLVACWTQIVVVTYGTVKPGSLGTKVFEAYITHVCSILGWWGSRWCRRSRYRLSCWSWPGHSIRTIELFPVERISRWARTQWRCHSCCASICCPARGLWLIRWIQKSRRCGASMVWWRWCLGRPHMLPIGEICASLTGWTRVSPRRGI